MPEKQEVGGWYSFVPMENVFLRHYLHYCIAGWPEVLLKTYSVHMISGIQLKMKFCKSKIIFKFWKLYAHVMEILPSSESATYAYRRGL